MRLVHRWARPRLRTRSQLLLIGLLSLLVFAGLLSGWGLLLRPTSAASPSVLPSASASNTFQQFLKESQQSESSHKPLSYSSTLSNILQPQNPTRYANLPPSAEPPTMQPITQALSAAFLQGGPTSSASPLDLVGSDGRLEVQVQPGSFDVSHATVGAGASPSGALSLQVSQLRGSFIGQSVSLGSYQVQLVDSQGQVLSGVQVRTPITLVYHYNPAELSLLGLDPGRVMLTIPDLIQAAAQANTSPAAYESLMQNDSTANTLTAQSTTLGPHPFTMTEEPQNQSPPTLHLAAMQGNNGQLTYSYPLQVPPGPGGFEPQLQLAYSSAGPNERHVANNPAGDEGDGWSLSVGSISEETNVYGQSYFINDVAGVGDRLVPTGSNNLYDTQHISYLRIQQVTGAGGQPCFDVWDKAGTFYEIGCTTNALQYWMDTNGVRHNYLWDVDKIIAPNEGPSASAYRLMLVTYVQDTTSNNGHTYVRDSALQQIIYGTGSTTSITTVVGTVDFTYHGPTAYSATSGDSSRNITWVTAYGTNYGCANPPPNHLNTTLRCDDPLNDGSSELAPLVMSTLTLDSVASYVGSDAGSGSSYEDDSYSLAYNSTPPPSSHDAPFAACTDPTSGSQEYCAGEHLLYSITPTVYQNNTGNTLHAVAFSYSSTLQNTYYDTTEKVGTQQYQAQTNWSYLSAYEDVNTGVGGIIGWKTAFNNTDGTPDKYNGGGALIDSRYDPFYCDNYPSDCTGNYAYPDNHAWSEQVVVSIASLGKDSSASTLQDATTTYSYQLAKTGTHQSGSQYCYPSGSDSDCVGDNWIPTTNTTDWKDYYDAEYQGFAQVQTTAPSGDQTVSKYYSTDGWYQPWSNYQDFLGGTLYEEDVYGNTGSTTPLQTTGYSYATSTNACRSTTPAPNWTPSPSRPARAARSSLSSSATTPTCVPPAPPPTGRVAVATVARPSARVSATTRPAT
jgi:hypothetical protein